MPNSLIYRYPVGIDLTNYIAENAGTMLIQSKPPAIEIISDPSGANQVAEVMLYEYGTNGFINGPVLAPGASGSGILRFPYTLRAYLTSHSGFEGTSATQCYAIAHGSFGSGGSGQQPWAATTTNTISMLRVRSNLGVPYYVDIIYGPGGGAAWTATTLTERVSDTTGDWGALLELVVDYPNAQLIGKVNGVIGATVPMLGWNGTRLPNLNSLGKVPWMSIISATGSSIVGQNWYSMWTGIEMEVGIKTR